jgi:hypothetical protein
MRIGLTLPIGQRELLAGDGVERGVVATPTTRASCVTGSAGYEALGISGLIVRLWPRTVEAVRQLVRQLRSCEWPMPGVG